MQIPWTLVQSSALAVALLAVRMGWTRDTTYGFLLWNLLLAWIPYGCALALAELSRRRAHALVFFALFAAWLGFLPNAPYLVTDFIHLRYRDGAPLWFDALMLASFAWAGVGLGIASLRTCSAIVEARHGRTAARAFVALSGLAIGFGIYLGRFIRFNTWDVLTRPVAVLRVASSPVVHPLHHPHAWAFTVTFALFFLTAFSGASRMMVGQAISSISRRSE